MPRGKESNTLVKSKTDVSPTRSVKFDLPKRSDTMSEKSPPRSRRLSPQAKVSGKQRSPARGSSDERRDSRNQLKSRTPDRQKSLSPKSKASSSPRQRSSLSAKRQNSLSPPKSSRRTASKSPKRGQSGKTQITKRSSSKDGSSKDTKSKEPEQDEFKLTPSGLKIVDWSGQGMTSIPNSLINGKDIGHLILISNNLRSLPVEMKRMKTLEKLDISKNGFRCTHNADYTGLPKEMSSLTNLVELNISECNLPYVPAAIFLITSLKILDLSRNKINILPPEIGELTQLVKVNLQQTNITSLPAEIAYCQELEEIYLWGNVIETLPETLPEMPKLRVLALNYRSFSGVVDPYMENLLRKGQIKSEHIPMVVFELPALEVLDLESTKLNTLPDIYNIQLKQLYLCKNFLQTIPQSIYSLKYLDTLDISNNLLNVLPDDIGRLRCLHVLRLANNSFERVPASISHLYQLQELNMAQNRIRRLPSEIKGLKSLQILILERNNLQNLPDEICELTCLETLDLTDNEIRSLPLDLHHLKKLTRAHSFEKLRKVGLWLYKNPLEQPPPEVWRTEKPEHIFEYLQKLVIIKTENLQRQKIQVIGESDCGKTSLVRALTLKKSMLTKGCQDRTQVIEQTSWKTDNNVEFVINDFGGDTVYRPLYKSFLDSKALVLLVYDAARICEETFQSAIGQWLDMLCVRNSGAVVKIVGTKTDLLYPSREDEDATTIVSSDQELKLLYAPSESSKGNFEDNEDDFIDDLIEKQETALRNTSTPAILDPLHNQLVSEMVENHLKTKEVMLRSELTVVQTEIQNLSKSKSDEVTEVTDIEEAALKMLQIREQKLENIIKNPLKILPQVSSANSSDTLEGVQNLINDLEHLAIDKSLFPHAQRNIPAHWRRFKTTLKQQRGYFIHWEDLESAADLFNIENEELEECILYYHDTADVLWYKHTDGLSEIVFHKPKVLVEILASLYRHDIGEFLQYDSNKVFRSKGKLSKEQFETTREMFLKNGEISRPLLNCLWFHFNFNHADIAELLELLPMLEVCYAVPELAVPTTSLHTRPLVVLPWFNIDSDLTQLQELWSNNALVKERELNIIYTFPFILPPDILPSLSTQIHEFLDERMDWKDTIYGKSENEKILIKQTLNDDLENSHSAFPGTSAQEPPKPKGKLAILVRGSDFMQVQALAQDVVELINSQLLSYPGLYWQLQIPMGNMDIQSLTQTKSAKSRRSSKLRLK